MENAETLSNVVTIYFSKDRPMQLDLALSSNQVQSEDWINQKEIVLYKASNERFARAYHTLSIEHSSVDFIKETDFKKDLLACLKDKKYVLFVVDDCVFTRKYSLEKMCYTLDIFSGAIGFSLRLGENTTYCYPLGIDNDFPIMQKFDNNICTFNWVDVKNGDFAYPLEVSSSLYRVSDIMIYLQGVTYADPGFLEWAMSINTGIVKYSPYLACYQTSVAFCNPINKVNPNNNNRSGSNPDYSILSLLEKYENSLRIDNTDFLDFVSNGCHQEKEIRFI